MSLLQYTYLFFLVSVWEHFEHDTGRRRFRFGVFFEDNYRSMFI